MKWTLVYLAVIQGYTAPSWQTVPGFTSKAACQEAAKQVTSGNCYTDASTPPIAR